MAKREAQLFEWQGDFRTIQEIADMEGVGYSQAWGWVTWGHTSRDTVRKLAPRKPKPKKEIIAVIPKTELPKPIKVNANAIVRVHHNELDNMLNYLARVSKTTYQAAFEEFINYLYEGRIWSDKDNKEAIAKIKERLCNHANTNGLNEEYQAYKPQADEPHLRIAELLESHIVGLETENRQLKQRIAKILKHLHEIESEE